jgi:hypothetical protein
MNLFILFEQLLPQETFKKTHILADQLISQYDDQARAWTET